MRKRHTKTRARTGEKCGGAFPCYRLRQWNQASCPLRDFHCRNKKFSVIFQEKGGFVQVGTLLAIDTSKRQNPSHKSADVRFEANQSDAKSRFNAMDRNLKNTIALGTLALLGAANAASAQTFTFFPSNATINYVVANFTVVGYASGNFAHLQSPSSPTVNIVRGAILTDLSVYNSSIVNFSEGDVSSLDAIDSSTVNMSGGVISQQAAISSTFNISGGIVRQGLLADGSGTVNMSGGLAPFLSAFNSGTVNFSGGDIYALYAYNNSTVNIFGSNLTDTLINPDDGRSSEYVLNGTLTDGTILNNKPLLVQNGSSAIVTFNGNIVINAAPEPGSVALLVGLVTVGAGALRRRRR